MKNPGKRTSEMYRTEMIDCFIRKGFTRPDAVVALDCITALLSEMLEKGETVKIKGFGTFRVKKHGSYMTRKLYTGEPLHIEAYRYIRFVPSVKMLGSVNTLNKKHINTTE